MGLQLALAAYPILLVVLGFFLRRLIKQIDNLSNEHVKVREAVAVMKTEISYIKKELEQLKKAA